MSALAISDGRVASGGSSHGKAAEVRPHLYLVPADDPAPMRRPLRPVVATGPVARDSRPQLTERGLLAVLVVFAVLALASVTVIVASFFAVSNAPVDTPSGAQVAAGVQG